MIRAGLGTVGTAGGEGQGKGDQPGQLPSPWPSRWIRENSWNLGFSHLENGASKRPVPVAERDLRIQALADWCLREHRRRSSPAWARGSS